MKNLLTIEDVRWKPPFNINYGMGDISLDRKKREDFDFDVYLPTKRMNLQRPLVWTGLQKEQLIFSVFKGIKIPQISVLKHFTNYKEREYIYQVIDGKQRLSTLISYIDNEFCIDWNNQEYYFRDLHPYLQSNFYNCIYADIGYDYPDKRVSDDNKIKWFELINFAGTPQDIQHLNNLKSGKTKTNS
jgi:hypothetical protein